MRIYISFVPLYFHGYDTSRQHSFLWTNILAFFSLPHNLFPTSLLDLIIHKHLHCNSLVYILIFRGVDPLFIRQNMVSVGIFHFKKHS